MDRKLKENSYLSKEFKINVWHGNVNKYNCWKWPIETEKIKKITCNKCGQKGNYRKDCYSSSGTSPVPDKTPITPMYSSPTTVTQTVTALYAVPQSSLVIILKELAKVKQTNWQLRKSIQQMPLK